MSMRIILDTFFFEKTCFFLNSMPQISAGLNHFEQGQQKKKGEDVEI